MMENWERGTKNASGAIVRVYGSEKLEARLACQKKTLPYLRSFSGCLVPLEYDEDCDREGERAIYIQNGYKRAREVRAYGNLAQVYAVQNKFNVPQVTGVSVPDEVMKALKLTEAKTTKRNKSAQEAARMTVSAFIAQTHRINRRLKKAYAAGNLTARETLRRAGLVCGR